MKKILIIAILLLSSAAIAAPSESVKMVYKTTSYSGKIKTIEVDGRKKKVKENLAQDIPCSVSVSAIEDNRTNQQTLGRQFKKSFIPDGFEEWLAESFKDIDKLGIREQPDKKQVLRVQPSLLKLYASAKNLNLHGTVSMKFDYFVGDQKIKTALLRGNSTTLNWAGGDGEYVDVLNKAMQELFPKFAITTANVCKTI